MAEESTGLPDPRFEEMLSGGHPNSLGRTVEVVDQVLLQSDKLDRLISCYQSNDEVVRLRTSNAIKRVRKIKPEWLVPHLPKLLGSISMIEQASAKWTLANLFQMLCSHMDPDQLKAAKTILKSNLEDSSDWIVQKNTMETLSDWALTDRRLYRWLLPRLESRTGDPRKAVAGAAMKQLERLKAA